MSFLLLDAMLKVPQPLRKTPAAGTRPSSDKSWWGTGAGGGGGQELAGDKSWWWTGADRGGGQELVEDRSWWGTVSHTEATVSPLLERTHPQTAKVELALGPGVLSPVSSLLWFSVYGAHRPAPSCHPCPHSCKQNTSFQWAS